MLWPELFGNGQKFEMQAGMTPEAQMQMAVSNNTLNPTSAELWAQVSMNYVDAARQKYYDLTRFTYKQEPAMALPRGVQATINVPVVLGAGEASVNPTNWNTSNISQKYVPIKADLISTSFGIDMYDLANGETLDRFLGAAIESTVNKCFEKLGDAVRAVLPGSLSATVAPTSVYCGVIVTDDSTWGPEVVAKQVSKTFGDFGKPDSLVLNADLISALEPTNALSLGFDREGTYGIRHIGHSAGMSYVAGTTSTVGEGPDAVTTVDYVGKGLTCRHNAIGVVNTVADMSGYAQMIATRDLGLHNGIHLQLCTWIDPQSRQIMNSVQTYLGVQVLEPRFLSVLV